MGIRAIEYRPWKGERTDPNRRWLVISRHIFQRNFKAPAVIAILIIGIMLAHAYPIITAVVFPHKEITNVDMVGGNVMELFYPSTHTLNVTSGEVLILGEVKLIGTLNVTGPIQVKRGLSLDGTIRGDGRVSEWGATEGNATTEGIVDLKGDLLLGAEYIDFDDILEIVPVELLPLVESLLSANGTPQLSGQASLEGSGFILGNGTVEGAEVKDDPIEVPSYKQGYLTSGLLLIFAMLLAAIICADVIADDLANNSFVLYFSRPVRTGDYLLGKFVGLSLLMGIFCLLLPVLYVMVMIGTQTGSDYSGGLKILGLTLVAGIVTSLYFLPYGLLISSTTKSKAYAGVGIFMSFFVLSIISEIFQQFNENWMLIDPFENLFNFFQILYDGSLPDGISGGEVGVAITAFTVVPMVLVFYLLQRKGAGK